MPRKKKDQPLKIKRKQTEKIVQILASPSTTPPKDIPVVVTPPKSEKVIKLLKDLNWRKLSRTVIILATLLCGFALLYVNTVWSKPGDLLFFPRQLLETAYLKSNQNSVDAQLKILDNRLLSFIEIQNKHDCVQLIVAENELTHKLQEVDKSIGFGAENSQITYFEWLGNIPEHLSTESDCKVNIKINELKILGQQALWNADAVQSFATAHNQQMEILKAKYQQLINLSQQTSFHDQQDLDNFNNMMLRYNSLLTDNSPISAYSQALALQNAESVIYLKEEFHDHEDLVGTICFFLSAEQCNSQLLQAQWNSISQRPNYREKFNSSLRLMLDYLKLL